MINLKFSKMKTIKSILFTVIFTTISLQLSAQKTYSVVGCANLAWSSS